MVAVTVDRFKRHVVQAVWPALDRDPLTTGVVEQRHLRNVLRFLQENAVQRLKNAFTLSSDRWMAQSMVRFYSRLGPMVPNTIAGSWESKIGLGPHATARDFSAPVSLLDASLRLAQDHRLEHTTDQRYTVPHSEAMLVTEGSKRIFWQRLQQLSSNLTRYDAALKAALKGSEWSLGKWFVEGSASQCDDDLESASRRMAFAQGAYIFHDLSSADAPDSDLWKRLLVHNAAIVLGPQLLFSGAGIFEGPSDILQLAEFWLEQAYLGQLVQGVPRPITVRMDKDAKVKGELTFLRSHDVVDGVGVGESEPGGDVVLRATFEQPVGRDGVVKLSGGENVVGSVRVGRDAEQRVRIVRGEKPISDTIYINGGNANHEVGKYGLYRVTTGTYIPPTWSASFWERHALYDGVSSFSGLTGSAASIMTGGAMSSGLAACPVTI